MFQGINVNVSQKSVGRQMDLGLGFLWLHLLRCTVILIFEIVWRGKAQLSRFIEWKDTVE